MDVMLTKASAPGKSPQLADGIRAPRSSERRRKARHSASPKRAIDWLHLGRARASAKDRQFSRD
jgi:hypothetical protein